MFVAHLQGRPPSDLTDCPAAKLTRGGKTFIGEDGPMGRILVRGEQGHDIIHQLYPIEGEPVIDTSRARAPSTQPTCSRSCSTGDQDAGGWGDPSRSACTPPSREANDRGYECVVLSDCVAS